MSKTIKNRDLKNKIDTLVTATISQLSRDITAMVSTHLYAAILDGAKSTTETKPKKKRIARTRRKAKAKVEDLAPAVSTWLSQASNYVDPDPSSRTSNV